MSMSLQIRRKADYAEPAAQKRGRGYGVPTEADVTGGFCPVATCIKPLDASGACPIHGRKQADGPSGRPGTSQQPPTEIPA